MRESPGPPRARIKRRGREGFRKGRKEESASAFLCANLRGLCVKDASRI